MRTTKALVALAAIAAPGLVVSRVGGQQQPQPTADAVEEAQTQRDVAPARPEQTKSEHDRSDIVREPEPSSPVLEQQPDGRRETGFLFSRDPHNAKKPMETFEEAMKADVAAKPAVMAAQRLLPRVDTT